MTDELDQTTDEICNRFKAAWDAFLTKGDAIQPEIEQYVYDTTRVCAVKQKAKTDQTTITFPTRKLGILMFHILV